MTFTRQLCSRIRHIQVVHNIDLPSRSDGLGRGPHTGGRSADRLVLASWARGADAVESTMLVGTGKDPSVEVPNLD